MLESAVGGSRFVVLAEAEAVVVLLEGKSGGGVEERVWGGIGRS